LQIEEFAENGEIDKISVLTDKLDNDLISLCEVLKNLGLID